MTRTELPTRPRPTSPVDTRNRFAERPRVERRRRWRRRGLLLSLALVFAGAVWVLGWSDVLGVSSIEVVGAERAPETYVVLSSGIEAGTPMARVDTAEAERRISEMRVIGDVTVERIWPSTVRITVTERRAVTVAHRGDTLRLVDAQGIDFAVTRAVPRRLPLLDVDLDSAGPEQVAAGLAVVQGLPPAVARRVATVTVLTPDDVRLNLRSGAVVFWGDSAETAHKAEVLQALLRRQADRYDVRAPDSPTTVG